jgi:hypothetical protein
MGGMFTLVKIREGLERNDYADPGPYQHPQGTVAHEVEAAPNEPVRKSEGPSDKRSTAECTAVKPGTKTKSRH